MKTLGIALAIVIGLHGAGFAAAGQKSFESLDDAVNALVGALRAADRKALVEILGPEGAPIVWSGDDVADRAAFQRFVAAYDRAHRLEGGGGKVVLYVGDDDYPFAVPLVPDGPRWFWDTDAGDEELLYRRIGRNELSTIQTCLAYVDAQREYYSRDRGAGILSTRGIWRAPRASEMVSTGRHGPGRDRARSARSSPRRGRRATRSPNPASVCPIAAISIVCCSRKAPTRRAAPTTSSSRGT